MQVKDPVCGMVVSVSETTPREEHEGTTYFFCSAQCHRMFKAGPRHYVSVGPPGSAPPASNPDVKR
jgi:YHS domain-containing protein